MISYFICLQKNCSLNHLSDTEIFIVLGFVTVGESLFTMIASLACIYMLSLACPTGAFGVAQVGFGGASAKCEARNPLGHSQKRLLCRLAPRLQYIIGILAIFFCETLFYALVN